jgi:hypothetical protein
MITLGPGVKWYSSTAHLVPCKSLTIQMLGLVLSTKILRSEKFSEKVKKKNKLTIFARKVRKIITQMVWLD